MMSPEDESTADGGTYGSEYTTDDSATEVNDEKEFVFKVIVIGDYSVGKTVLVKRMLSTPYVPAGTEPVPLKDDSETQESLRSTVPTVGTDFFSRVVRNVRDKQHVRLQFWDTAGLERYAALQSSMYRNASAVIAVFDVADAASCENLLLRHLRAVAKNNPGIETRNVFVVANKIDLVKASPPTASQCFVTREFVESKLLRFLPDVHYYETSALANNGMPALLRALSHSLLSSQCGEEPVMLSSSDWLRNSQLPAAAVTASQNSTEPPSAEAPRDKAEAPRDKAEAPKDKAEAPKDKTEAPKDKAETPKDKAEAPKDKAEAPKDKGTCIEEKTEHIGSVCRETDLMSPVTDTEVPCQTVAVPRPEMASAQEDEGAEENFTHTEKESEGTARMDITAAKQKLSINEWGASLSFISEFPPPPSVCNTLPDISRARLSAAQSTRARKELESSAAGDSQRVSQPFSPREALSESSDLEDFKRFLHTKLQSAEESERGKVTVSEKQDKRDKKAQKIRLGQEKKKTKTKCNVFKC